MWRVALLLLVGALAGCKDNRTFDQRFNETSNHIEQRAANLDAEASGAEAGNTVEEDQPKAPQSD